MFGEVCGWSRLPDVASASVTILVVDLATEAWSKGEVGEPEAREAPPRLALASVSGFAPAVNPQSMTTGGESIGIGAG